jgi:hypothetical protein
MKIAPINSCDDCPYFDNEYYSYERFCNKLDRVIADTENIPEDCPLEDYEGTT